MAVFHALLVFLAITSVYGQTCPPAATSGCPYDLTYTTTTITTGTNINSVGRLSSNNGDSTQWNMQFTPTQPGKYTFSFAADDLCKYTNQTQVVQARCPPAPTVVATPSNSSPKQGQAVTITNTGSAPAANFAVTLTYTWKVVSSPVGTGVWTAGATFPTGYISSTTLSIPGTDLGVAGTYVISLTASDGCSSTTINTCFRVICNCGPAASASATPTLWSNVNQGSSRNNQFSSGSFVLKGGNSYDFDFLYNAGAEKLTYSWSFVSWVPAAPLPNPNTIVGSPQIPNTKQPPTWTAGQSIPASLNSVGYRVLYTPPVVNASPIVKVWAFQQLPQLVTSTWVNTTSAGTTTTTTSTPATTGNWVPLYNNNGGTGGEEWFQSYSLTPPPTGVPDQPTTTSMAAWVSNTVTSVTVTTPQTAVHTMTTPAQASIVTYCQITITQSPSGSVLAPNYWEAQLAITGTYNFPLSNSPAQSFQYEQCRGLWTFSLTVQDACGSSTESVDTFKLTIRCNRPPVAIVGCNATALWQTASAKFDQVTADGRGSNDADNNVLTYYWQFTGTLPAQYVANCAHAACRQQYCNDPTLYTAFTFPTGAGAGTATKTWGNGNNQGFTQGTQGGSCCTGSVCGPTVYPMLYRPSTLPPPGSTCRAWMAPPTNIPAPSPASQPNCEYAALPPTNTFVGNAAYFTPSAAGTYQVQLTVYDGCSSVISVANVIAKCPTMTLSIGLAASSGTFSIVTASNPQVATSVTLTYPEGDWSKLTYSWTVTNQAGGYTFSSNTAYSPTFKPTAAPRSYTVQLTVSDGCQSMSASAPTYSLVCSAQSSQPTIEVFQGATTTGSPLCQGTGPNSVCSTAIQLETAGNQYPQVTLRANSTKANGDPLTYTWVFDNYATSISYSPTSTSQTVTFRPQFTAATVSSGFSVRWTVYANDQCQNSPSSTLQINFACTATLAASVSGQFPSVQYAFNGGSGAFPSVAFNGMASTMPYPTNTAWQWSISYSNGAGTISVTSGITPTVTGGAAAPIGNITFTATLVTRYTISLLLSDKCRSVQSSTTLTTSCAGAPVAVVDTPSQTVEWDSFKTTYVGGFPLVTLKSSSTPVSVTLPTTNTELVNPTWSASGGGSNQANTGTLAQPNAINPTFTPTTPGQYSFSLSVTNGPCASASPATATVTANCLTIGIVLSTSSNALVWDGVRFPTLGLDGTGTTYKNAASADGNFYALSYEWKFTNSPTNSMFRKSETVVTNGANTMTPLNPTFTGATSTNPAGATVYNESATYSMVQVTTTTVWTTTLFNHHYNRALTCFKPDLVGTYTVQLTVFDGCTSATQSSTVNVRCNNPVNPSVVATNGNIPVTLNGTAYQRVMLDGRATTPTNPATDTLTYTWTLTSVPNAITPSTPKVSTLSTGTASIMNANGNYASFVPDVAGSYSVVFTVNDGCNAAATRTITVTVLCNSRVTVAAPSVLIGTALQTASIPSIDFTTSGWSGTFTLQGVATTNCEVVSRSWTLINRQCADIFQPTAPAPPTPAPVAASTCTTETKTCVWTVDQWPCAAATNAGWQRPTQCSGTGTSACTLALTNTATCTTAFTPRFPGQYVLKLTVTDGCSTATANTTVTARCESKPVAVAGTNQMSLYTCTGTSYSYQTVTLNGAASSVLNTPAEDLACPSSNPSPTPAPTNPPATGQCCPAPVPCSNCVGICPNCAVCAAPAGAPVAAGMHSTFAAAEEEALPSQASLVLRTMLGPVALITLLSVTANVVMLGKLARRRAGYKS